MNINPTTLRNLYKPSMMSIGKYSAARDTEAVHSAAVSAEKTDRISISSQGSQQKEIGRLVRNTMRDVQEASSPQRIESIRSQIQDNTYHVSTDNLADALMSRIFGE